MQERAVRLSIGKAYSELGEYVNAESEFRTARALTPDLSMEGLAEIDLELGSTLSALDRAREASESWANAAKYGTAPIRLLALVRLTASRPDTSVQSEDTIAELLRLRSLLEALLGPKHPRLDAVIEALSSTYSNAGRYKEGVSLAREMLDRNRERYGPHDVRSLLAESQLGQTLQWADDPEKAVEILAGILPRLCEVLGPNHLQCLTAAVHLGMSYDRVSRFDDAIALLKVTLDRLRANFGADHDLTQAALNNLASAYGNQGDYRRALPLLDELLEQMTAKHGESAPEVVMVAYNRAMNYARVGDLAMAESLLARLHEIERTERPNHWRVGAIATSHGSVMEREGRLDEAEAKYAEAVEQLTRTQGAEDYWAEEARTKLTKLRQRRKSQLP